MFETMGVTAGYYRTTGARTYTDFVDDLRCEEERANLSAECRRLSSEQNRKGCRRRRGCSVLRLDSGISQDTADSCSCFLFLWWPPPPTAASPPPPRRQVGPGEWLSVVYAKQRDGSYKIVRRFALYLERPAASQ